MKRIIKGATSAAATEARFTQTMDSRRGFRTIVAAPLERGKAVKGCSHMTCYVRCAKTSRDLIYVADSISGFRTIIK